MLLSVQRNVVSFLFVLMVLWFYFTEETNIFLAPVSCTVLSETSVSHTYFVHSVWLVLLLSFFFSENSHMPIVRFLAAAAIRVAALREWGLLTDEDKRNLIVYGFSLLWNVTVKKVLCLSWLICLHCFKKLAHFWYRFFLGFVMERASASDTYVQSKVSAVAAQLIKRGW